LHINFLQLGKEGTKTLASFLRAHLVDCNGNYIGIGINITRNAKFCYIMVITIHLFGDNITIES